MIPIKESNQVIPSSAPAAYPWYYHKFFPYAIGTLLVLTIMLVFYKVSFFLTPLLDFVSTLFIPVVISLLFYYLLRPIVQLFERFKIPRFITILMIYFFIGLFFVLFIAYIGPVLAKQITALANTSMETLESARASSNSLMSRFFNINLDKEIEQRLFGFAQQTTAVVSKNIVDFIAYITHLAAILAVIPFVVFYLLKDDHNFSDGFLRYVPEDFGKGVRKILQNMDKTLSTYINGLVIVSASLGCLLFIGYLIIGLEYALVLSLIAIVFTTIPFLGPFLAIAPALFVALADSPFMVIKVVLVFIVVQQCESNFISPQIIGQRLNIHPLTLILLLLAAGTLYGLIGLLLATPLYALVKVLIENLYKIYQLHYVHWK